MGTTAGTVKLICSAAYIVLGLAMLSMAFNLMMEEMIAKFKWLGQKMGIVYDPTKEMGGDKAGLVNNEVPQAVEEAAGKF